MKVVTARERVAEGIAELEAVLARRGGLWEDQRFRLETLRDVEKWMAEEDAIRAEIEQEAALAAAAEKPENKYADTRKLFESYKKRR